VGSGEWAAGRGGPGGGGAGFGPQKTQKTRNWRVNLRGTVRGRVLLEAGAAEAAWLCRVRSVGWRGLVGWAGLAFNATSFERKGGSPMAPTFSGTARAVR
jgi:hypothetical protein